MATLDPKNTKSLFDNLVEKTKGNINDDLKDELLTQFQQPSEPLSAKDLVDNK